MKQQDAQDYARELKSWLKRENLSVDWLAERLAKSKGTVYNYLSGHDVMSDAVRVAIDHLREEHGKRNAAIASIDLSAVITVSCALSQDEMRKVESAAAVERKAVAAFFRSAILKTTAAVLTDARISSKETG